MLIKSKIKKTLLSSSKIVIAAHEFPDGDSLGSSIALYQALKGLGLQVFLVASDLVPSKFFFLETAKNFIPANKINYDRKTTIVFLDCADQHRPGEFLYNNMKKCGQVINIDHHQGNTQFGDLNCVDVKAAATGEIIFDLLQTMSVEIGPSIATALYTAIVTDTGSFKFNNTTSKTFDIARQLLDCGADTLGVNINIWENETLSSIRLLADVLGTLKVTCEGKVAYVIVTHGALKKWNINPTELEGMVNYPKSLHGVEVAIIFKEIEPNKIKVSFRSKTKIDVRQIASQFKGGGHFNAAGCTINEPLPVSINKVMQYIEQNISYG